MYGRRRVGKTYLVEQTFSPYFAFRATGLETGNTRQQLKSFNQRLREHGDPNKTIPRDWFEAFSRLESVLSQNSITRSPHGKRIVFFDEFPWFATPKSGFLEAFGEFWNRCGTASGDYLFIICGSATSWIIQHVLENTGSLYNRITCQVHLDPFTLRETEQYMQKRNFGWSRIQIAECYMVFGGLPYFLDLLDADMSLAQNIDRLCFEPHALLRNESAKLLEATLSKSSSYSQILDRLSRKRHGMKKSACFEDAPIPKGTFHRAVDDLVKCGYVKEFTARRQRHKPIYLQLSDPFLLFHYAFLADGAADGVSSWADFSRDTGRYANWRGHAFEMLCLGHVAQVKTALGIAGVHTDEYPWESQSKAGDAQIDLIIERADGIANICEMKFTDKPFAISADYEVKLLNKRDMFAQEAGIKHALRIVLVCAAGLAGVAHTEHVASVLTIDDLFE